VNYGCNDAAETLAAYALDALPVGERMLLVEHLAECRQHDEELSSYRAVAGRLPLTVPAPALPAGLRGNLLAAFDREQATAPTPLPVREPAETAAPAPVEPAPAAPEPERPNGGFWSIFRQPALAYGIAAALLIAVIGLGVWNLSLQEDANVMTTAAAGPGMSMRVSYYGNQGVAVFDVDMPDPASGQVYQAWMISHDGKHVSLGLLEHNHGKTAFAADMSAAGAVAISLEPAGGSATPTTPIVEAKF
jgi:anti-sigma-K factor RskA